MITRSDVQEAADRVRGRVVHTPCTPSEPFGEMFGGHAWFKFENLQRTGSFKERGAVNRMLALDGEERARGVIAASAGNHAQAVAFHAARLGTPATIVMPERTPLTKVSNTRQYGARVVLHGSIYDEAMEEALRLRDEAGSTLIHPFDDPRIIAGQGTIGLELLEQVPDLDTVVVPVGGGGLISGIAVALKEQRPGIRVVGVEAATVAAASASRAEGKRVTVPGAETIADGIATRTIGEHTFPIIERYVDDLVTVDEEEIASAILLLLEREKTVTEGAAAVSLAAVLGGRITKLAGQNVVMMLCGGNIDMNLLSRIIERGQMGDGRMARLKVRLSDRPGGLAGLTRLLADRGANVVQLDHRRGTGEIWVTEAEVALTLETRGREHVREVLDALRTAGYTPTEV